MTYDINQQVIDVGMTEYMKKTVNKFESLTSDVISDAKRFFRMYELSQKEREEYIKEIKGNLDLYLKMFIKEPEKNTPRIIPEKIAWEYIPELKTIADETKTSLDKLLLNSTEVAK